jgi:phage terminase large subunit GpA-like protein
MKIDLDCPSCGQNMIKSYENEAKFRAKVLKWDRNGMFAICKSCSHEVPITLDFMKSIQSTFVYEVGEGEKKD